MCESTPRFESSPANMTLWNKKQLFHVRGFFATHIYTSLQDISNQIINDVLNCNPIVVMRLINLFLHELWETWILSSHRTLFQANSDEICQLFNKTITLPSVLLSLVFDFCFIFCKYPCFSLILR